MEWATPDDVIRSWIGSDVPTDEEKVGVWIGRAERLIRSHFPTIGDRIGSDEPDLLENVQDVVVSMVTRVFRNPHGYRSMSGQQTTGPYATNDNITFGGNNPGSLELLDSEKDLLRGASGQSGDAFSVDLLAGYEGHSRGPHWWLAHGRQSQW